MTTTLDSAATSTKFVLSGGNLTTTYTSSTGYGSTASQVSSGSATKIYFEAVLDADASASGFTGFGVTSSNTGFQNGDLGAGPLSIGYYSDGLVYRNAATVTTAAPFSAGHRIAIAADITARTAQVRNITTASAWSAAVTFTNAGFSAYAGFSATANGSKATFIFDGPFVGTPPAGDYAEWDSDVIGGAASYTLTATTAVMALAGTTTGLFAARLLGATVGALALTGNAANLIKTAVGAVLTATTGALALTGTTTNLVYTQVRSIIAQVGTLLLTGNPAGVIYTPLNQYTLTATPGTLVLAGNYAQLNANQLERQPGPLRFGRKVTINRLW
jgi:hypothetical protein